MNLEKYRAQKGWSQGLLAEKSGVSQTYISELESHKKIPPYRLLKGWQQL